MRFLTGPRPLDSLLPIGQHFLERPFDSLQGGDVICDPFHFFLGQLVNALTGSASGIPGLQYFREFCQREADAERSLNDQHSFQRAGWIDAVSGFRSRGSWKNTDSFIVSNGIWTYARRFGQGPGTKTVGTIALHHGKYQLWNAFQSQAVFED